LSLELDALPDVPAVDPVVDDDELELPEPIVAFVRIHSPRADELELAVPDVPVVPLDA